MTPLPAPIVHPPRGDLPVLLSVPHSGRDYPDWLVDMAASGRTSLSALEDPLVDRLIWRALSHGCGAVIAPGDRYLAHFRRMLSTLTRRADVVEACEDATRIVRTTPAEADVSMLDVDAVVSRWCAERGLVVPGDVEARVALHVEAVLAQLEELAAPSPAAERDAPT